MTIQDKDGTVIAISDPPGSRIFDNMVIRHAYLAGQELEGISFDNSDLRGSDLTERTFAAHSWPTLISKDACWPVLICGIHSSTKSTFATQICVAPACL